MANNIYQSIANIMNDVPAVGKDSKNKSQGFKYRGIDSIYNALQPVFAKHGVFSVPEVLEQACEWRESKNGGWLQYVTLKVKYTFYAADGSNVSCSVVGMGMDSGDKAANKAMAVAHKYAITQVVKLPFASDDPDAESHSLADRSDGVYRVPFGKKHKGKSIAEIGIDEAFSYASYLHKDCTEKGEEPSAQLAEFFAEVKKARGAK